MRKALLILGIALPAAWGQGQICNTTTYVGTGVAQDSFTVAFYPSNAYCAPGSTTSALSWTISTAGWAGCPTDFHFGYTASQNYWNFSDLFTADFGAGPNGAGCWLGRGPGFFMGPLVSDCSSGGDTGNVCRDVYFLSIGQFSSGFYYPGAMYVYGVTQCSPAKAYQTVTECFCSTNINQSCGVCGTIDCAGNCEDPCSAPLSRVGQTAKQVTQYPATRIK